MTTITLHANLQRSRFAQHARAVIAQLIPAPLLAARNTAKAAAADVQKVRDLAYSYSKTDPGFSSDLYAAAARHEGLYAD